MSKEVTIGKVTIGNGHPIAIQSMSNLPTTNVDAVVSQALQLQNAGCDILRVAVKTQDCCKAIKLIKDKVDMPIVADVHFDYRLAVSSLENGADKIRINPGNVSADAVATIVECAKTHNAPIRIGVNGGSVAKEFLQKYDNKVDAMVQNLLAYVRLFESKEFDNLVLSLKSSSIVETVMANRLISKLTNYPLHVGVTEAGPYPQALVKNAIGIGALLLDGIGDTIRVSATADPLVEIQSAKEILTSIGKYNLAEFVSCPKCGRCNVDLESIATKVYEKVKNIDKKVKIAVMGCEVNGPGECADADLGMAGGNGKFAFFKHGKVYKTVKEDVALDEFFKEIDLLIEDKF